MSNSRSLEIASGFLFFLTIVLPASAAEVVPGYEVTRKGTSAAGFEAKNHAQEFKARFTIDGVRFAPEADENAWELGLSWIGYGRGASSWAVASPALSSYGARVESRRGELAEWYENSPKGIEQGFTLPAAPEDVARRSGASVNPTWVGKLGRNPNDADRLVHVDMALIGNLRPRIAEDGRSIDFFSPDGARVVRYADLRVTDARHRDVPAWMEGFAGDGPRGIRIVFDPREATYPITIDPIVTTPAWTVESDQASAHLGFSVATAGDVNGDGYSDVLVGAPEFDGSFTDEGRVTLYLGSPSGLGVTPAWTMYGGQASRHFGYGVRTAGDVNGDGYSDVLVDSQQDVARLYLGSPSGLSTNAAWTGGISCSAAGDVTADGYADVICGLDQLGTTGLYLGSATGLSTTLAWSRSFQHIGAPSLGTAGDVNGDGYADVVIGTPLDFPDQHGAMYLFLGISTGLAPAPSFTAVGNSSYAQFGRSVLTAGDMNGDGFADVVVGQSNGPFGSQPDTHVYLGSPAGLSAGFSLAFGLAGYSVATAGDVDDDGFADVVLGQPNTPPQGGKVYVYSGKTNQLSATITGNQSGAQFGNSVATAGDVNGDGYADIVVGAPFYDNGQTDEGRAYVYLGSPSLQSYGDTTVEGNETGATLGLSVAGAGDVNGDGYADVIAGGFESQGYNDAKVFVYHGSASGMASTPSWTASIGEYGAAFGASVAGAGDVDGDGYSDVIIGAPYESLDLGGAHVYRGSTTGLASSPAWSAVGEIGEGNFGTSVASAGDVNGDGFDDVIVGAPSWLPSDFGHVFVYLGSASGLGATAAWSTSGNHAGDAFGYSVATAGDVNGDGYADVIVGAPDFYTGQGYAAIYLGSATGLHGASTVLVSDITYFSTFGQCVSSAGDVNRDGFSDVLVTELAYDVNTGVYKGQASLYLGAAAGLARIWTSGLHEQWYGLTAAAAGDLNGDGHADVIVGAPFVDNANGDVLLYYGSPSGLSAAVDEGSLDVGARTGYSVAGAGDVDGDGLADFVLGSPYFASPEAGEGAVTDAYGGKQNDSLGLHPRQRRSDGTAPVSRYGFAEAPDGLAIHLIGRTPFGRGRVSLEAEVRPYGAAFTGVATHATPRTDTGIAGVPLELTLGGLSDGTRYRWRARLVYDPITTPFQHTTGWISIPWDSNAMPAFRTSLAAGGFSGAGGSGMGVGKPPGLTGSSITLTWGASCTSTDSDFEVYEGALGNFSSHVPVTCSTGGATSWTFAMPSGNSYFLVVPRNAAREGSYGIRTGGSEIPASASACLPQQIASCP